MYMAFPSFLKLLSIQRTCHQWLNVTPIPTRFDIFTEQRRLENVEMLSVTPLERTATLSLQFSLVFKFQTIRHLCFG